MALPPPVLCMTMNSSKGGNDAIENTHAVHNALASVFPVQDIEISVAIKICLIVQMLRWSLSNTIRKKLLSIVAKSDTFGIDDVSYFTQELDIVHEKVKNITSDVLKTVSLLLDPSVEGAAMKIGTMLSGLWLN